MTDSDPGADPEDGATSSDAAGTVDSTGFLSSQPDRREAESVFVRLVATAGIIGIGTALGAILTVNSVAGWITGLVVSLVSVVLAAVLWRSRQL